MDAKFMAGTEQEAEEEWAAHAAFDAEQERCREAVAAEDESDDDEFERGCHQQGSARPTELW
jgi:hypothetical protein